MKPKFIPLVEMCVETGVRMGIARAFKHTDDPTEAEIYEKISTAVMNEFYEWFTFDKDEINPP